MRARSAAAAAATCVAPPLLTWLAVLREVGVGALQAVGAIAVYTLVLYIVLKNYVRSDLLRDAVALRSPVMGVASGASSPPPSVAARP